MSENTETEAGTALAERPEAPPPAEARAPTSDVGRALAVIKEAALNPQVDTDKMRALMDMQFDLIDRQAAQAFARDLVAAQEAMPVIPKTATNTHTKSKYAKLDHIIATIKPIYTRFGFSLSFGEEDSPRGPELVRVVCDLSHRDGHTKRYHTDLLPDGAGAKGTNNKTGVQAVGSTLSYGRRYLTCLIFNLATGDDDDGNGGRGNDAPPRQQRREEPPPTVAPEQLVKLRDLIKQAGADEVKFAAVCKVDCLENLPASKFDAAAKRLQARIVEQLTPREGEVQPRQTTDARPAPPQGPQKSAGTFIPMSASTHQYLRGLLKTAGLNEADVQAQFGCPLADIGHQDAQRVVDWIGEAQQRVSGSGA